jgi:DNA-binding HxlR family transcriptional regulator
VLAALQDGPVRFNDLRRRVDEVVFLTSASVQKTRRMWPD